MAQLLCITVVLPSLNRAERPCEERTDYSFTRCLRSSITTRLGCRFSWDVWSPSSAPLCTKAEHTDARLTGTARTEYA